MRRVARDLRRAHHAARAAIAEAAGHQDALRAVEQRLAAFLLERFGLDPVHVHLQPVLEAAVHQRFVQALVRILEPDVLADDVDGDFVVGVLEPLDEVFPVAHVGSVCGRCRCSSRMRSMPFPREHERHLVDAAHVLRGDHRFFVDVAEERDLALDVGRQEAIGAAQQDVGLDADRSQVAHAVLRRLGLELAGGADVRHQRQVDVERVLAADVLAELADRLEERQALDVADGAADLDDHDVDAVRDRADAVLDRVGDVRNHLHGRAEVVAAALALDDRQEDLAGGPVVVAAGDRVGEPLVVAEVEVGLGAIVGDVDLAVLVRAHRPRVDVDVGVELLQRDPVAVALEQTADGGGREAFAERRDDAAGDEDVLDGTRVRALHGDLPGHSARSPAFRTDVGDADERMARTRATSASVSTPIESKCVSTTLMRMPCSSARSCSSDSRSSSGVGASAASRSSVARR